MAENNFCVRSPAKLTQLTLSAFFSQIFLYFFLVCYWIGGVDWIGLDDDDMAVVVAAAAAEWNSI